MASWAVDTEVSLGMYLLFLLPKVAWRELQFDTQGCSPSKERGKGSRHTVSKSILVKI